MSHHCSSRPARERALLKIAPTVRPLPGSFGLSVLVLLSFTGRADAACYLRLNMWALPRPHVVFNDSSRTTYGAGYKQTVFSHACGLGIGWPIETAVQVKGEWNKITKTAKETVIVAVSTPFFANSPKASYSGVTTQSCKQDPWNVYNAGCPSWQWWWITGGGIGVAKQQASKGWNTGFIPWNGFDYRGPYPASRPAMGCCWFEPWPF